MKKNNSSFVNVDLTDVQLMRYEDASIFPDDWPIFAQETAVAGYKITFRHDLERGSWSVYIVDSRDKGLNANTILSAWAGSLERAFQKVSIVFNVALEEGLSWKKTVDALKREQEKDWMEYIQYLDRKRRSERSKGGTDDVIE